MKYLLLIVLLLSGCNGINYCNESSNELADIVVGEMHNYKFDDSENENHLTKEITSINSAIRWIKQNIKYAIDTSGDYWNLPEETFNDEEGDCEDFCILFMYLLKEKLNINTNLIMLKHKETGDTHTIIYPFPFGSERLPYYYDVVDNIITKEIPKHSYILYTISYEEVIWMSYHYHNNVGEYK